MNLILFCLHSYAHLITMKNNLITFQLTLYKRHCDVQFLQHLYPEGLVLNNSQSPSLKLAIPYLLAETIPILKT